jgi:hypothetical protein
MPPFVANNAKQKGLRLALVSRVGDRKIDQFIALRTRTSLFEIL